MRPPPAVSVIIPAYESHATLRGCLSALEAQTFRDFEVILVDSGPSGQGAAIAAQEFPWVRLVRPEQRMLPHQARNLGVTLARSDLLVFTDPDIYAGPEWLARLVAAHQARGDVSVGSVACHGDRWIDRGTHLAKFDLWLPGGMRRPVEIAPTLNVLCPRAVFEAVGGFPGEYMVGDTIFSWNVAAAGYRLTFEPKAVVSHHHMTTWRELLRERYTRGAEFGRVRSRLANWSRLRMAYHLAVSLLPLRLVKLTWRTLRHAAAADQGVDSLLTLPVIVSAHAAWLAGESQGFLAELGKRGSG